MAEVWGSRPAPHHRRDQGRSVPVEVRHLTTTAVVDTVWLNGALGGRIVLDGELNTVISFVIDDGRISIGGRTLIRTSGESRVEQQLSDDAALLTAYGEHFGIILDRVPAAAPS